MITGMYQQQGELGAMDISRKLGIMIFSAVPAIIGGGIVYHFFGSFVQVIIYECVLLLAAIGCIGHK